MRSTRREFLGNVVNGLGAIGLLSLLERDLVAATPPLVVPKAKRVIQLFMNGGASQCDLFDYKPKLAELHGRSFDPGAGRRVEASVSTPGAVMKSPFTWAQHGCCGRWVSSALPHTAKIVD